MIISEIFLLLGMVCFAIGFFIVIRRVRKIEKNQLEAIKASSNLMGDFMKIYGAAHEKMGASINMLEKEVLKNDN